MAQIKCRNCGEISHQTNDRYDPTRMPAGDMFDLIPGSVPAVNQWSTFHDANDIGENLPCPHCEAPYADSDGHIRTIQFDDEEILKYAKYMSSYGCDDKFVEGILGEKACTEKVIVPSALQKMNDNCSIAPNCPDEIIVPEQNAHCCPECGRLCKSKRGLQIHEATHQQKSGEIEL